MTIKAHFDGKVLVPDEPVDLPVNSAVEVEIKVVPPTPGDAPPLLKLVAALGKIPENPDWPADGAAQHDHYLYGLPKRP